MERLVAGIAMAFVAGAVVVAGQTRTALPDGTAKPLLSVPAYDFNWQTYYRFKEPIAVPKGARIFSSAWYDNSARNPSNPDPAAEVRWGDQTWEEMQYTGFLYTVKPAAAATQPR